MKSKLYFQTKH